MSTLNKLMDKNAAEWTNEEVDQIIIEIRKSLAMFDAGAKPKKEMGEAKGLDTIMAGMMKASAAPAVKGRRRM